MAGAALDELAAVVRVAGQGFVAVQVHDLQVHEGRGPGGSGQAGQRGQGEEGGDQAFHGQAPGLDADFNVPRLQTGLASRAG